MDSGQRPTQTIPRLHLEPTDAAIVGPQPVHLRPDDETPADFDDEGDEREATELRALQDAAAPSPPIPHRSRTGRSTIRCCDGIRKFWRHQVTLSVPHADCRDHLANERTFLSYLRSSLALSMLGTAIAQFYRLEPDPDHSKVFGFFVLGKPLAVIFLGSALIVVAVGGLRYLRQQNAMALGKVHAGGWEVYVVGALVMALLFMMFVVHIGLIIYKGEHPDR